MYKLIERHSINSDSTLGKVRNQVFKHFNHLKKQLKSNYSIFMQTKCHTIVVGYYVFTLAFHVSVHPSVLYVRANKLVPRGLVFGCL